MPRVRTIIPKEQNEILRLLPNEIALDPAFEIARPGPLSPGEQKSLEDLAFSMQEVGQIVPVVVTPRGNGYVLIDGRRRYEAAKLIDGFKLDCVIGWATIRTAIHANLKRRGYNHLQFAYLCAKLRKLNNWEGTKEISDYLGVSRAYVSQHDKLLRKPEGMNEDGFKELQMKVGSKGWGAEAAFYALTHVKADRVAEVLDLATQIANPIIHTTSVELINGTLSASTPQPEAPTQPSTRMSESEASHEPSKTSKPASKPKSPPRVTEKHVRQAARELNAIKEDRPLQRGLADFERVFKIMSSTAYPDIMRSFVSFMDQEWRRGEGSDEQLIARWTQLALLVENCRQREEQHKKVLARKLTK
jgi:ParB/RepB/Spo0J family partition protein